MIIDGQKMASEILARVKARAAKLARRPLVVALVGTDTPATRSYLAIKTKKAAEAGCIFETRALGASFDDAGAVIVQLPVPAGMDQRKVCDAIPISKDADVLSSAARALFENAEMKGFVNPSLILLPPVTGAVREIFLRNNVALNGKKTVVIGAGFLVGAPIAVWFRQQGSDVEVIDKPSDFAVARTTLATADVIVSGAGSPHLIKPDMLKHGVVLIDAGTSESNGEIVGDADPMCADKCSIFTPVPGGIGPLAVACLFENVVILAERKNSSIL